MSKAEQLHEIFKKISSEVFFDQSGICATTPQFWERFAQEVESLFAQKESEEISSPAVRAVDGDAVRRASANAQTRVSAPLTRDFDPLKVGYTRGMFADSFPDVDYERTLSSFLSFYIASGRTSCNWLEGFLGWSSEANRRAKTSVETDATGLPVNPALRRTLTGQVKGASTISAAEQERLGL